MLELGYGLGGDCAAFRHSATGRRGTRRQRNGPGAATPGPRFDRRTYHVARLRAAAATHPRFTMNNFSKRFWQNRWIRGSAWATVSIVTLYILVCGWLNWTGARSWKATLDSLAAAGETTNFRQICSDPIPAEDNFCAIPLLSDLPLAAEENKEAFREGIGNAWRRRACRRGAII